MEALNSAGFVITRTANKYGSPSAEEVLICKGYLHQNYRPIQRITRGRRGDCGSYRLKHVVERAVGRYISNGALIQAASALGFKVTREDPNSLNGLVYIEKI